MRCGRPFRRLFFPVLLAGLASGCRAVQGPPGPSRSWRGTPRPKSRSPGARSASSTRSRRPSSPRPIRLRRPATTGPPDCAPPPPRKDSQWRGPPQVISWTKRAWPATSSPFRPKSRSDCSVRRSNHRLSGRGAVCGTRPHHRIGAAGRLRGLVKVEDRRQHDDIPCPPGQRRFRYDVPPSGNVEATGPALLRRLPNFVASYAEGPPQHEGQGRQGRLAVAGVRRGAQKTLVVGTLAEFYSYRQHP